MTPPAPNEVDLPWQCEICLRTSLARDSTFRVRAFLPPRGDWKTATCAACAAKERAS